MKLMFNKALSGRRAVEMVSQRVKMCREQEGQQMYALILLDYSLGDNFDGPDVAREIRSIVRAAGLR